MIAITFSLPDESRAFLRAARVTSRSGHGVGSALRAVLGETHLVIHHIGVGRARAAVEAERLLSEVKPTLVVCAGYAGALQPGMKLGDVILDRRGHLIAPPARCRMGKVHTVGTVAESAAEKRQLGASTGALAVDMETAVLAEIFEPAGIPLVSLRAISDRMEDELPVPMAHWFDLGHQRPRPLALLTYLARHPSRIVPFARFVRGLAPAREALAAALVELATTEARRA